CVEQDDKGWDARKRAYCLKIQPATGSFARNLIYSTKPLPRFTPSTHVSSSIPRSSRHNANQSLFPRRSSRQDVMKRLVLALLLFIFKESAVAPALTPEADITLVNPSMFAREGYRRHNMMLSMCSHKPPVHES
ncbi:hypothetical protein, partial [Klebsiella pneumoniae]